MMRTGSGLLAQLERCGLSAKLAEEHQEVSDDASGSRATRHEIARAYHANDQAQLPEADAALRWLMAEGGQVVSVCQALDLIDPETGEVLVQGKPGAVLVKDDGEVLVVAWQVGEQHDPIEPDDDLGLVAMGLAATMMRLPPGVPAWPFRAAHVVAKEHEAFCRRSEVFKPESHAALLERIRKAVSRPRIACPGDWCGGCRQAPYCEAWIARAKTALAVIAKETELDRLEQAGAVTCLPHLEITNENSGPLKARTMILKKVCDMLDEQIKAHVRRGGHCVVNGKELHLGECNGRETVSAADLRQFVAMRTIPADALAGVVARLLKDQDGHVVCLKSELEALVKVGKPYEMPTWRKPAGAARKR